MLGRPRRCGILLALIGLGAGCKNVASPSGPDPAADRLTFALSLGTGPVTISGTLTNNAGPLTGVLVQLSGTAQASVNTDSAGNYVFSGAKAGSYTVTPSLVNCTFTPPTANLNNLTTGTKVQNFTGAGSSCTGVSLGPPP